MKEFLSRIILVVIFTLGLNACGGASSPIATSGGRVSTPIQPTTVSLTPAKSQVPQGETIRVTSTADDGSGTLRQALQDAQAGDIITFDPDIFPPDAPVTIFLSSELPPINQGHLIMDASNAGVIVDGRNIAGDFVPGLQVMSNGNIVQGIQVVHFTGAGIVLSGGAQNNIIGGDRGIGMGPVGQGNLTSGNIMGIGLWDEDTSFNTITGNLVGVNTTGKEDLGNRGCGIWIGEGASRNTIGPDNIISHNAEAGIRISHPDAIGNTITHNRIFENGMFGIHLEDGGNSRLTAPVLFDFDLSTGTVKGGACANCTVEIFSDRGEEGETYEGRTVVNDNGEFTFTSGAPFKGPHLTATATDIDGNTSSFSTSTTGEKLSLALQVGNDMPKTRLLTLRSSDLTDNRIGSQWDGLAQDDLRGIVDSELFSQGLKRVRLSANSISWDHIDWDVPEFTIDPGVDDLLRMIAESDVKITYVLSFWDKAGGKGENCPRFKTEEEVQRYIDFVSFIVRHLKDRVQYFEIWNEPDIGVCVQNIEVDDYIDLVRRVAPVIRQEFPDAAVKVGGTINPREAENRNYLFGILSSDVMSLVDAISWHMGPSVSPQYEYWRAYYYEYPSLVQEIKDTAAANGFTGEYIADELTWWTAESVPDYEEYMGTYSEIVSAKYYARGIILNLGMDITVGIGGTSPQRRISFSTVRNLCTIMAGAKPLSLPIEIQSEASDIVNYGFVQSNGNILVALWTDGVAVEDDPGVSTTLTFPGLSAQEVVGIDVLYGFEQQLMLEAEEGNMVIRDLLVKDYPIILHFSGVISP
jgi:parallel beta-helix repeat protein